MPSLPLQQCTCHCWGMSEAAKDLWLAEVDGCPGGWIAAFFRPTGDDYVVAVYPNFAHMLAAPQMPDIVAVDIPIGLPERSGSRRPRCRECRQAFAWAASIVGILGSLANRDLRVGLRRRVSRRARHLRTAAQSIEAIVQHRAEESGGRCSPLHQSRVHDARFRSPSGIGVLAPERRATANRGEKNQKSALRAWPHFAAETVGSGRPAARAHACTAERSGR